MLCRKILINAVAFLLLLNGCSETTTSTDISTPAIWADILVEGTKPGVARVAVELNVGGQLGTNIELDGNERLEASIGGIPVVLQKDIGLFGIEYNADLVTSGFSDEVQITYFRNDGTILNGSSVRLDEFTITSPAEGQAFTDSDIVSVTWTPASTINGEGIELRATILCNTLTGLSINAGFVRTVPYTGIALINLQNEAALDNPQIDKTKSCGFSINLERNQQGVLDPEFEAGGRIMSKQSRNLDGMSITFTTHGS